MEQLATHVMQGNMGRTMSNKPCRIDFVGAVILSSHVAMAS
jgi:hypothetical protein